MIKVEIKLEGIITNEGEFETQEIAESWVNELSQPWMGFNSEGDYVLKEGYVVEYIEE
jgi:hypothetical protein